VTQTPIQAANFEIDRLTARIQALIEVNNRDLDLRRAAERDCAGWQETARVLVENTGDHLERIAELERQLADVIADSFNLAALEHRAAEWVVTRIGIDHMQSRERAMRLLEEAFELAQAEGITVDQASAQMTHVFGRDAGEPAKEAGGVAFCLLAWCAATGHHLMEIVRAEADRVEAKPIEQIRGSVARKAEADLFVCAVKPGERADG
jgi:hypothetical protein